jgi:ribosomal protein L44E
MALPMNSTPVYNLTIPSTGKVINYRPFLIKEEKALLVAQQSEDPKVMMDTLKQVIRDCVEDKQLQVNDLATFDIEYMFLQIRAKSVGEVVELNLKCDTCEDEKAFARVNIDLTKLQVEKEDGHNAKINLFNDVGVIMKYPSFDTIKKFEGLDNNNVDQMFEIVIDCIDAIYTTEEVYHSKEQTKQDLLDFLNNLTSDQFVKIQQFFETMPKLRKHIDYSCPVCGKEHHKVLEGIASFF